MQKLDESLMKTHEQESMSSDYVPAIEGAKFYFALVDYHGKQVLCILDESDQWHPTNYTEMMQLMKWP